MKLKTAPLAGTVLIVGAGIISAAGEGWDEAAITCSTTPIQEFESADRLNFNDASALTDYSWALNTNGRVRLAARMGVGNYTSRFRGHGIGLGAPVFESKDEGTDNALGPRLTFAWTKTL